MAETPRDQVRMRAGGVCEYCRLPDWATPEDPFHCDHVRPRQHGGPDDEQNRAWCCSRCNLHKGTNLSGVDPDGTGIVNLFSPRSQRWSEHFALREDRILGLTPVGRATVWLFQMNAERRVELRRQIRLSETP